MILFILLCGFSVFIALDYLAAAIAISVGAVLIPIIHTRSSVFKKRALATVCISAFILSVLLAMLWQALFFPREYYGRSVKVEGRVESISYSDVVDSIVIKTERIDGEDSPHKLLLYLNEGDEMPAEGDLLSLVATIEPIVADGESLYYHSYELSRGISAYAYRESDMTVSDGGVTLTLLLTKMRLSVADRLAEITNERTGGFLSALITGDRSRLDPNTGLNFTRIGISHILALSGSHLAILAFALTKLLSVFKLNKKVVRAFVALFTFMYMAFTGFSPSVTRAGIMLIICAVLFLIAKAQDGVTALFVSVALILLINPTSVFDLSLWLSALATLGIIFYSELRYERKKSSVGIRKRVIGYLTDGIYSSVFAIGATLVITMLSFSSVSLLGPVSTLIFSFIIEVFIYLGLIALAVGSFIPMGVILNPFSDGIMILAEKMSSPKWVCASAEPVAVKILSAVLVVIFFAYMIFGSGKLKRAFPIACTVLLCSVYLTSAIISSSVRRDDAVIYGTDDGSDVILVKSDGDTSAILNSADTDGAAELKAIMQDEQLNYIDSIIISEYTADAVKVIRSVIGKIKTEKIFLPNPRSTSEMDIAENMSELLSDYGASLNFYPRETKLMLGKCTYTLISSADMSGGTSESIFLLQDGDLVITYCAVGAYRFDDTRLYSVLSNTDILLLGSGEYVGTPRLSFVHRQIGTIYMGRYYYIPDEVRQICEDEGIALVRISSPVKVKD